jgi:hypothetical protein
MRAAGRHDAIKIGRMQVKGKDNAVVLYSIFEESIEDTVLATWHNALEAFTARRWDEARQAFSVIEEGRSPLKKAAAFYRTQCERLSTAELDSEWAGEVVFDSK